MTTHQASDPRCPNCAKTVSGPYCSHCGQRQGDMPQGRQVLTGLLGSTLNVDGAWPRTLSDLLLRPHLLLRDYRAGAHARYVNPVVLLLTLYTAFLLVVNGLEIDLFQGIKQKQNLMSSVATFVETYAGYLTLLYTAPVAWASARLWPGTKALDRYMALLYVQALATLVSIPLLPLYLWHSASANFINYLLPFAAASYALRDIRPSRIGSVGAAVALSALTYLATLTLAFAAAFVAGIVHALIKGG